MMLAAMYLPAQASDSISSFKKYLPEIHATMRARYELSTADGTGRFQVRNARVNLKGNVSDYLGYFLRVDFCDRGAIRLQDAYGIFSPTQKWKIMMGQMRVPLSVDASRAVNTYWFSNRSLANRDQWTSRKVGAKARYSFNIAKLPAFVEGGVFSSASTTAQTTWSKDYTYGIIGAITLGDFMPEIGFQSNMLGTTRCNLWNASVTWVHGPWEAETEFLYKIYTNKGAKDTKAFNLMGRRFFPIRSPYANRLSLDLRFDCATDNCDGLRGEDGRLLVTLTGRKRITAGTTIAYLNGPLKAHLRLNYEQYFHSDDHKYSPADGNKLCVELMLHF